MPNSIEWDLPQQVLSDVHRIPSGAGATVAVLSDLCNGKSRVCIPGRYHSRPLTDSAALKYGALPASVRVGQGSAIGAGPSPLASPFGPEATAIPDSARPIVGRPGRL